MAKFVYRARDLVGSIREGSVEAESVQAASVAVTAGGGLFLTEIRPAKTSGIKGDVRIPGITDRIPMAELSVCSRQLAAMVEAGLPLLRALGVLAEQTKRKRLAEVWTTVRDDVQSGSSLSEALARHPKVFSRLYVSLVRAGETAGALDVILARIAATLEQSVKLRGKIRSAVAYPAMVAGLVMVVLTAVMIFVVPSFSTLYADLGGELPLATRVLIAVSEIFRRFLPLVLLAVGMAVFGSRKWYQSDAGRLAIDRLKLRLPLFGPLMQKAVMSRFSRTMSVLLKSGVGILQALDVTSETVNNALISRALTDVEQRVRYGTSLSAALQSHAEFPPLCTQMVAVGEEAGATDDMLSKVADFFDDEVESTVSALTSILEPVLVATLGGVVGAILLSLYLPMFRIIELIQ